MTRRILGSIIIASFLSCASVAADMISFPNESANTPEISDTATVHEKTTKSTFDHPDHSASSESFVGSFLFQLSVVALLSSFYFYWKRKKMKAESPKQSNEVVNLSSTEK